jgi:hypothetical protein
MAALVGLVESAVSRHREGLADLVAAQFDFAGRAARGEAPGRDVLFFGDSVVKFGVVPRLIQERTGLRSYNLATAGNPAPVAHVLLRRALEAGARPRAVFVDFKPLLLTGYRVDAPTLARIGGLRDGLGLAWAARDPGLFGEFAAAQTLPTVRDRRAIRAAILAGLRARPDPDRPSTEARRRNWAVNQGAQVFPPNPLAQSTAEFPNEAPNLRPDWSCHPVNAAYIDGFFRLAAEHRIPAYWLLTPIHPRLQAGRDRLGLDDALTRFLAERAGASGVTVVDARRLGLDPDLFVDATHLDRRGAAALSAALAEFLADVDRPAGPGRWVVLPPRPRPLDDGRIEDTDQSALALRAGTGWTRNWGQAPAEYRRSQSPVPSSQGLCNPPDPR